MIPLHSLWANLNNKMRDQFECDMTCFCFDLVRSYALCDCFVQIKQVHYKMSTKNGGSGAGGSFELGSPSSRGVEEI